MKILIKKSQFYNEDKYERIQGIINYINALQEGLYKDEELDQQIPLAQEVYFVDYYLGQVENGGIFQYFSNSNFNESQNSIVLRGLDNMGAHKHKELFQKAWQLLIKMGTDEREEYLFAGLYDRESVRQKPGIKEVAEQLDKLDDLFFKLNGGEESIDDLIYKYIEKVDNLRVVNDESYDLELKEILSRVPNFEERKRKAEEDWAKNQPRYSKVVNSICQKYGLELISINAMDYGEDFVSEEEAKNNYENDIMYYYISTDKGYHYIIDEGNQLIVFNGETNKKIGSMPSEDID